MKSPHQWKYWCISSIVSYNKLNIYAWVNIIIIHIEYKHLLVILYTSSNMPSILELVLVLFDMRKFYFMKNSMHKRLLEYTSYTNNQIYTLCIHAMGVRLQYAFYLSLLLLFLSLDLERFLLVLCLFDTEDLASLDFDLDRVRLFLCLERCLCLLEDLLLLLDRPIAICKSFQYGGHAHSKSNDPIEPVSNEMYVM